MEAALTNMVCFSTHEDQIMAAYLTFTVLKWPALHLLTPLMKDVSFRIEK